MRTYRTAYRDGPTPAPAAWVDCPLFCTAAGADTAGPRYSRGSHGQRDGAEAVLRQCDKKRAHYGHGQLCGRHPFTVPAGLLVMAVPVQAGQTVKAGDTLAVFDAAEVDRAVNAKRAALQQARTQAAQQTAGDTADPLRRPARPAAIRTCLRGNTQNLRRW